MGLCPLPPRPSARPPARPRPIPRRRPARPPARPPARARAMFCKNINQCTNALLECRAAPLACGAGRIAENARDRNAFEMPQFAKSPQGSAGSGAEGRLPDHCTRRLRQAPVASGEESDRPQWAPQWAPPLVLRRASCLAQWAPFLIDLLLVRSKGASIKGKGAHCGKYDAGRKKGRVPTVVPTVGARASRQPYHPQPRF